MSHLVGVGCRSIGRESCDFVQPWKKEEIKDCLGWPVLMIWVQTWQTSKEASSLTTCLLCCRQLSASEVPPWNSGDPPRVIWYFPCSIALSVLRGDVLIQSDTFDAHFGSWALFEGGLCDHKNVPEFPECQQGAICTGILKFLPSCGAW